MAGQVSPGIVLRERDLTAQTIVATQANTAGLVGSFERGPVGVIVNIATEKELLETFGSPNADNFEDWFTASTFLSYGGQLNVVRVDNSGLKNAATEVTAVSSDATKLYVANITTFAVNDYVKVDNEIFLVTAVDTTAQTLTVTRGALGTSQANHASGATVIEQSLSQPAGFAATTVAEPLDATETIITLSQTTGLAVGDFIRVDSEYMRINSVESPEVVVTRGALGSTAATHLTAASVQRWTLTDVTPATTLTVAYPLVSGTTAPAIKSKTDFDANYGSYSWKFAARTAGLWGNELKVVSIDGSVATFANENIFGTTKWSTISNAPATANDLHLAVLDANNNLLETYLYVSRLSNAKDAQGGSRYYKDVINNRSAYIYAGSGNVAAGNNTLQLSGGLDSYTSTVSDITSAFDVFSDVETVTVDFILTGGSLSNRADQITKAQKTIDVANTRKDCIAFVSPHKAFVALSSASAQRDDIISFFDSVGSSTSYAVFDSGYKYIYDRFNDVYRYIPCNGDVAGLCVQTSTNAEDWFSPAGVQRGSIKNAVKLAYSPTKTDRDKLYLKRINPVSAFPGQGIILFGDKTALATPSAFDRINVRRLFLAIEKRMNNLAKNVLFELNDSSTRIGFSNAANSFLSEVLAKRGVIDYLVVCDETNNTPDVIDRNEFVAEIYVKPTRSINYVTITVVATRTGVEFSEITGQTV